MKATYLIGVSILALVLVSGLAKINIQHKLNLPTEFTNPNTVLSTTEFQLGNPVMYTQYDITLRDEIRDTKDVEDVVKTLRTAKKGDVINFHIAGFGGRVDTVFYIINNIKRSKAIVNMIVEAPSYSGHAYLAVSGDTLTMLPYSYLMFHTSSGYGEDCSKATGTDRTVSNVEHCQDAMAAHLREIDKLIDNIKYLTSAQQFLIKTGHDVYLDAEDYNARVK